MTNLLTRLGRSAPPPWALILLAVVLWGGEYARRGLWEPDEARYAYVAREMRETGQWLVPRRFGEYYAHKPPLMFWLINASSLLTGGEIDGISARLPSLLGAVMTLWAVSQLAFKWVGAAAAWRTVFVLCTSFLFWHEGGMGQIDSLLCGLECMALALLFRGDERPSRGEQAAAYVFMGLAILAKGPVGLIVPLGSYAAARLAAGERAALRGGHWLWGPVLALSLPAVWLLLVWRAGAPAGYFHEVLFSQTVERAGGALGHAKPPTYFLGYLPLDFLPWTVFIPAALLAAWRDGELKRVGRRLLGWIAFPVLFFSLIASKRNLYILLAYPALAMLVAAAWPAMARLSPRWQRVSGVIFGALLLLVGTAGLAAGFHPQWPGDARVTWPTAAILLAGAAAITRMVLHEGLSRRVLMMAVVTMACAQITAANLILPALDSVKTPHRLAVAARDMLPPGQPLLLFRLQGEILALYSEHPGDRMDSLEELLATIRRRDRGIVVMRQRDWPDVRDRLASLRGPFAFQMGGKELLWLEFGDPLEP